MAHTDVTVVCEGAVDDSRTFTDEKHLQAFLESMERECDESGVVVEVFLLRHDHPMSEDDECSCAQYVTDGHPNYVFGGKED